MEFTKSFLKEMENLQKKSKFYDYEKRRKVNEEMFNLGDNATDEQIFLFCALDDAKDDEEFYNIIHALDRILGGFKK